MDCFVSTFVNKLDAKGRVSVPAEFRKVLAAQETSGLYCVKSISRDPALTAFGNTLLSEMRASLKPRNPLLDRNYTSEAHGLFGQVRHLQIDDDGRIRLPDDLIEHCGITDRVAFVGLADVFEIWMPEKADAKAIERIGQVQAIYDASGDSK